MHLFAPFCPVQTASILDDNRGTIARERIVLMATDSFIRLAEVLKRTSLSRATLYRKIQDGSFPAQTKLSTRRCGWKESVLQNWCDNPINWSADIMLPPDHT